MGVLIVAFNVFVMTASVAFLLGAYYQHDKALRNLQKLIQSDPYAFYLRRKLYGVLKTFEIRSSGASGGPNDSDDAARMEDIMKYGFPGLDDVRLYSDFVLSYDRCNRVAHWVYEHLNADSVRRDSPVRENLGVYQPDMSVPSNFRSSLDDYRDSGFERGHMAVAGNHKAMQNHCNDTFFMTNIAPQIRKGFNREAWITLESYVRELTQRYGSVYVCTGPLYLPKMHKNGKLYVEYEVIGPSTVAVPTHFFKVITVESKLPEGKPYMEAYIMPNSHMDRNVDIRTFLSDIGCVERASGLQFFDGLRRSQFFATNYKSTPEVYENFT